MHNIILTCGDPNGIGLEVCIKALMRFSERPMQNITFSLAVQTDTFWEYLAKLQSTVPAFVSRTESGFAVQDMQCRIIPCGEKTSVDFGKETREGGILSWESLKICAQMLKGNEPKADAVVTMPVSKRALHLAGFPFPGQTEFFAHEFGTDSQMMILATEAAELDPQHSPVRMGLATVHIPLAKVASSLSIERILERITTLHITLKNDFGIATPRIAVLGVNPHAGEQGDIGQEELEIIQPAIEQVKKLGVQAEGAFPADGFFAHGAFRSYDGILAMYHDQGLIPLKLLAGNGGVNFSAGLPIVRTSPDHGTAFALAGQGIANESSVVDAINMACSILQNRRKVS